jgi:hypothetical protein
VLSGENIIMKKYGIGSGIFTIIFGVIFTFSAYTFFSILLGVGADDVNSPFLGLLLGIVFLPLVLSAVAGVISGFLTIILLITTIDRIKSAIRQAKFEKQQATQS